MFPAEETTAFPTIGVFGQFLTRPVTDAFAGVAPLTTAAPACRPARPPAVVPAVLPARPPARRPRAKSRAVVPLPPLGALFAGADGTAAEFLAVLRLEWPTAYPPTAAPVTTTAANPARRGPRQELRSRGGAAGATLASPGAGTRARVTTCPRSPSCGTPPRRPSCRRIGRPTCGPVRTRRDNRRGSRSPASARAFRELGTSPSSSGARSSHPSSRTRIRRLRRRAPPPRLRSPTPRASRVPPCQKGRRSPLQSRHSCAIL